MEMIFIRERERGDSTQSTSTMAPFVTEYTTPTSNHRMLIVNFYGIPITTTVTSTPSVVRKWLRTTLWRRSRHLNHLIVGLGVQWFPSRYQGDESPAATLQLCIGRRCLIFQLIHSDYVPRLLRRLLVNPKNTFVGFWNHSDAKKLENSKHKLEMLYGPLDLRHYVVSNTGESLARASVETIIKECLGYEGVRLETLISRSEWDAYDLSSDQVLQASVDAHAAFLLGTALFRGRSDHMSID